MPETAAGRFRWTIGALLFLRHKSESCPADPGRPGALQYAGDRAPMEFPRGKVAESDGVLQSPSRQEEAHPGENQQR